VTRATITLRGLLDLRDVPDLPVAGIAHDSHQAGPGVVFFCVPGASADGHDFAAEAVARGASALVVERSLGLDVPEVVVDSARAALARAAARFYGDPSHALDVAGITGTNGKTTTGWILREILEADGRRCGLLGTIKEIVGGAERLPHLTTPAAIDLQHDLRQMADAGDAACVMELSSHGLAQSRCDEVRFKAAVFTNLSRDHLDFHDSMSEYFETKRRLFLTEPEIPVVNADDPYGRSLAQERPRTATFALERPADYRARDLRRGPEGSRFVIEESEGTVEATLPIPGRHNVENALAAYATARRLGVPRDVAVSTLASIRAIPGRFQRVDEEQAFAVVVDFAHNPGGLEQTLRTARELTSAGLTCVFGCVGGRDPGMRSPMGEIASRLCERVIVTTDDCFDEDPRHIVAQIMRGTSANADVIMDRAEAIEHAVATARPGDSVVIAGHGHLRRQVFASGRSVPFDDVEVARRALHRRAADQPEPRRSAARRSTHSPNFPPT
jgi:UDP-N-acetylmuramoyl-L-alanyl-D-glutamate--2,6-diaminopimelate ligase